MDGEDWGSIITAVGNVASGVISGTKATSTLPVYSTPPYQSQQTNPLSTLGGMVQGQVNDTVTTSIGAALKQYWWVLAFPVGLMVWLIVLMSKKGYRR
jgi:hypothetical protein